MGWRRSGDAPRRALTEDGSTARAIARSERPEQPSVTGFDVPTSQPGPLGRRSTTQTPCNEPADGDTRNDAGENLLGGPPGAPLGRRHIPAGLRLLHPHRALRNPEPPPLNVESLDVDLDHPDARSRPPVFAALGDGYGRGRIDVWYRGGATSMSWPNRTTQTTQATNEPIVTPAITGTGDRRCFSTPSRARTARRRRSARRRCVPGPGLVGSPAWSWSASGARPLSRRSAGG